MIWDDTVNVPHFGECTTWYHIKIAVFHAVGSKLPWTARFFNLITNDVKEIVDESNHYGPVYGR
jgi:hypothetical protein